MLWCFWGPIREEVVWCESIARHGVFFYSRRRGAPRATSMADMGELGRKGLGTGAVLQRCGGVRGAWKR